MSERQQPRQQPRAKNIAHANDGGGGHGPPAPLDPPLPIDDYNCYYNNNYYY